MKHKAALLVLVLSLCVSVSGRSQMRISETGKDRFQAEFSSGGQLRIYVRSGAVRVVGGKENRIFVHYGGRNADRATEVRVSLKKSGNLGELSISGGPRNEFEITIEVPERLDLNLRMFAGELKIQGINGNQDAELHFGDMTITMGNREDYLHVDASVTSGGLDAHPFGISKGGLFRSFSKEGNGRYRLHAHVGAGQLTLE